MVSSHARVATDAAGWSCVAHGWTCAPCGLAKLWVTSKSCWPCGAAKTKTAPSSGDHSAAHTGKEHTQLLRQVDLADLLGKVSQFDGYEDTVELQALQKRGTQERAEAMQAKLPSTPPGKVNTLWAAVERGTRRGRPSALTRRSSTARPRRSAGPSPMRRGGSGGRCGIPRKSNVLTTLQRRHSTTFCAVISEVALVCLGLA